MNTALEYSTRVVQERDRRCKKSTLNDLAYLTPLRIPLMNPVKDIFSFCFAFSYASGAREVESVHHWANHKEKLKISRRHTYTYKWYTCT
jgi:hypothetical protein